MEGEGEYQLVAIDPSELESVWHIVSPLLVKVVDQSSGRYTMQTLVAEVMSGDLGLWGAVGHKGLTAVGGTQILVTTSGYKSLFVRFVVGKNAHDWLDTVLDELEVYARSIGCQRLEALARKGWAKYLPDYKLSHILLEKDL